MHATIHHFRRSIADESPAWAAALADRLHGDRAAGRLTAAELGGRDGVVVAFWPTEQDATDAVARRIAGGPVALDAGVYRVLDSHDGITRAELPSVAQLTCFDGPRSRAQADAAARAGRERLWPAVRDLPGLVAVHVLRDADNGEVVIGLATGVETLEAAQRAILTTELLPGEDPALLSDPDRVQIHRVLEARLPESHKVGEPA